VKILEQVFKNGERGVASLIVVIVLSMAFIAISIAMARTNLVNFQSIEMMKSSRKSYYLAESGVEDSLEQLVRNINYPGNPSGEITPIGTYNSTIEHTGNVYSISSSSENNKTYRIVNLNVTIVYMVAPVSTKSTYMADFFVMYGEGARVRGDVWTNDDFDLIYSAVIEGNLYAAGKGSMAVNWVWDGAPFGNPSLQGAQVKDNPDTPEPDGNLVAYDNVKVSGPHAVVEGNVTSNKNVYRLFGGTINGTITQNAGTVWVPIPVPVFSFDQYKQQAIAQGTYFSNANSFTNYLNSIDNGVERRLPGSLYYVDGGALKIYAGHPVYLDGLLVSKDDIYIYCEWHQSAQGGLPALVSGKSIHIENKYNLFQLKFDPAGPVRINGIIFANKSITLFRTFSNEDIIIEGAVWAGDDISVQTHSYVHYNVDTMNIQGFNFVNGISDVQKNYWREIVE
jgi:hypothetical protein